MDTNEKKETTLEEDFRHMEELLKDMEREDIGIEEAFSKYSEGMTLIKSCNEKIDRVEKKVLKIAEDGGLEEL